MGKHFGFFLVDGYFLPPFSPMSPLHACDKETWQANKISVTWKKQNKDKSPKGYKVA